MIALLLIMACVALTDALFDWVARGDPLVYWACWICYYVLGEVAHRREYLYCPSARRSRFARWVGRRLARVQMTRDALRRMRRLAQTRAPNTPIIFACVPHNPYCLHATFCFAAHGDLNGLPAEIADRTFVVGHWSQRFIPLVRDILSVFGVVASLRGAVRPILERGDHLALMPDGLLGKYSALADNERKSGSQKRLVMRIDTDRLGWAVFAVRYHALVVPVLSPDEGGAYNYYYPIPRLGALEEAAPLWAFALGRYLVLPLHKVRVQVGNVLDAGELNGHTDDAEALARFISAFYLSVRAKLRRQYKLEIVGKSEVIDWR